MSIIQVDLPHIRDLIYRGIAVAINEDISSKFAKYIEDNYKFVQPTGYSIDWDDVPNNIRLRWDQATTKEVENFIYSTTVASHFQVAIWYGRTQPCLVCDFSFAAKNLDLLFHSGWGVRYIFGSKGGESTNKFVFSDFIEVNSNMWISGIKRIVHPK